MCLYVCVCVNFKKPQHQRENGLLVNTAHCTVEYWYFVSKIVLTYCEKKIVLVIEKTF